jgi:2,3-bisphosphoglycerate-independent phosphoglycerate mutase
MKHRKVILIILDGWGIGKKDNNNPIWRADTKNMDFLLSNYPNSKLKASGEAVGLPKGVMGNSEVGHLNLGSGRHILQDLVKISQACKNGSLEQNKILNEAINKAKIKNRSLHFIGLASSAGVHSHLSHLYKMCEIANKRGLNNIFIHAITDGRDTNPKDGLSYIKKLEKNVKRTGARVASIIGRYYSMDRDKHWERIKKGYDLMIFGKGEKYMSAREAILNSYQKGITDEFIKPKVIIDKNKKPIGLIKNGDVVICFNFRTERLREMTIALNQKNITKYKMKKIPLHYYTLTKYSDFKRVKEIFSRNDVKNTIGEIISKNKLTQLRIAETEKYAHVTYFFSGGRDELFKGEKRILINSPRVATYDLKPEMSAFKITEAVNKEMKNSKSDFVCLNFANGDMVGHTGNFKAIMKAIEVVDRCVGDIYKKNKNNYSFVITADHGNAESAINSDGSFNTTHSTNKVPFVVVSSNYKQVREGALYDVAPTILKIMGLKKPKEMTGKSLV